MKPNSRAYNRKISWKKALRKKHIAEDIYYNGKECPYYDNLHQYSKNKIHCSCPDCSPRTNPKGKKRDQFWGTKKDNYKISEKKKIESMEQDLNEWEQE